MQIQLINLEGSADRLAQFRSVNNHLNDIVRFPASSGNLIDPQRLVDEGFMTPDLSYTSGAIERAKSHTDLWKMAVAEHRAITVAEDDTLFSKQFEKNATDLLAAIQPDWDIVIWGFNPALFLWVDLLPGVLPAEIRWNHDVISGNLLEFQYAETCPQLHRLLHEFGTQCYSISPKGAKGMLDCCLPLRKDLIHFLHFPIVVENHGIDCAMNRFYPHANAFVCLPPLVAANNPAIG